MGRIIGFVLDLFYWLKETVFRLRVRFVRAIGHIRAASLRQKIVTLGVVLLAVMVSLFIARQVASVVGGVNQTLIETLSGFGIPAMVILGSLFFLFIIIKPFEAFVCWIFFAPLLENRPLGFELLTFNRVALGVILFSTIIRKLAKGRKQGGINFGFLDLTIFVFTAICLASVLLSRPDIGAMEANLTYYKGTALGKIAAAKNLKDAFYSFADHVLYGFIAFYIVRNLVDTRRKVIIVIAAVASLCIYLTPIGVLEHFTGKTFFRSVYTEELAFRDVNRAAGPFENPSVYGTVLGMGLVFAIHLYFQAASSFRRFLCLAAIFLIGVGEVMTFTRAAWLSPILAFLVMVMLYKGRRKQLLVWLSIGVIALIAAFPVIRSSEFYKKRITSTSELESRLYVAHQQRLMFLDKPLLGFGFGNFDYYKYDYPIYVKEAPTIKVGTASHNTFVTILVETGLVGFIPYLLAFILVFAQFWGAYRRKDLSDADKRLLVAVAAAPVCYIATGFVVDFRHFRYVEYLFWSNMAMILVVRSLALKEAAGHTEIEPAADQPLPRRARAVAF
jgi:O-antigen ligase